MKNLAILTLFLTACNFAWSHETQTSPPDQQPRVPDPSKIVVLPHPDLPLDPTKTVIWCGTAQLAWNEMIEQLGGKPILANPVKEVDLMNQQDFTKADLDEASYFVTSGISGDDFKKKIEEGIALKFPDLKDFQSRLTSASRDPKDSISSYAFMRKNLTFKKPFFSNIGVFQFKNKRNGPSGDTGYCHFGLSPLALSIDEKKEVDLNTYSQVQVLHYRSPDECVVGLRTQDPNEELILASVEPRKNLKETIEVALNLISGKKAANFTGLDTLDIPVVDFDVIHTFSSLSSRPLLKNPPDTLGITEQAIKFSLTEDGVKLIAEVITVTSASNAPVERPKTVEAVFDQPFLMILKRRESKVPYLACWIGNTETFKSIK